MRISDWSSDVCSSDLVVWLCRTGAGRVFPVDGRQSGVVRWPLFWRERRERYCRQGAAFMATVRIALAALALLAATPAEAESVDRWRPYIAEASEIGRARLNSSH